MISISCPRKHSATGKQGYNTLRPSSESYFCRAELNSGIKFDKITAEVRRLNQLKIKFGKSSKFDKLCRATIQDSNTAAIQASCFCRAN